MGGPNLRPVASVLVLLCVAAAAPACRASEKPEKKRKKEMTFAEADALDPWRLDLETLRRREAALVRHPEAYLLPEGAGQADLLAGLGAPGLPAFWASFARLTIEDRAAWRDDTLQQTHREMLPEHLPGLAGLLEAEDAAVFEELLWMLLTGSHSTDRHREDVARACLYAVARREADASGTARPRLAEFTVDEPREGLPEAFRTLARHLWSSPASFSPAPPSVPAPWVPDPMWLLRWARDLAPAPGDVPFLLETLGRKEWFDERVWAVRALAALDDPAAREVVRDAAAADDDLAPFAAAELARRGDPDRFLVLLQRPDPPENVRLLALALGIAPTAGWVPEPSDLSRFEASAGIRIAPVAIRPLLEAEFAAAGAGSETLRTLDVWGDLVPGKSIETLVERVLREPPPAEDDQSFLDADDPPPALAVLEVRAPDLLSRLLGWFARSPNSEARGPALRLLARTGDARCIDETLAGIDDLLDTEGLAFWAVEAAADLGGLRDPRLRAVMVERARSDDPGVAWPALVSLCVTHGLDRRLLPYFVLQDAPPPAVLDRIRSAALAGDPIGAMLALDEQPDAGLGEGVAHLGRSKDPRALAHLRRLHDERTDRYWPATAGLALAGDAAAKRELTGWVRDARTVMLDDLHGLLAIAMETDPATEELIIEWLESNCCLGFYATVALKQRFPTLDTRYAMYDFPETRRRIRSWYDRHRGRFAWSRIAGGLVPIGPDR